MSMSATIYLEIFIVTDPEYRGRGGGKDVNFRGGGVLKELHIYKMNDSNGAQRDLQSILDTIL